MRVTLRSRWVRHALLLGATLFGAGACATARLPTEELSRAEIAVRKADEIGAVQYAPLELHVAREKLEQAGEATNRKEYDQARRLADEALVDAELAETIARAEKARRHAEEVRKTVDALRGESWRPFSE
jgi:hypothetical protein